VPEAENKWTLASLLNEIASATEDNTAKLSEFADLLREQTAVSREQFGLALRQIESVKNRPKPGLWKRIKLVFWPE
jgi:hypothetical protein